MYVCLYDGRSAWKHERAVLCSSACGRYTLLHSIPPKTTKTKFGSPPTPPTMVHVIIAGAGIAGLSAAVALRRAGNTVDVFERSSMNGEAGVGIQEAPNATRLLAAWGLDPVQWRFTKSKAYVYGDPISLGSINSVAMGQISQALGGADMYHAHRADLHSCLRWMATREDGPGTPVTIMAGSNAVDYVSHSLCLRSLLETGHS